MIRLQCQRLRYYIFLALLVLLAIIFQFGLLQQATTESVDWKDVPEESASCLSRSICHYIPSHLTASSIWQRHLDLIHSASIHPDDTTGLHANWTRRMLEHLLTPLRLQQGLIVSPDQDDSMNHIMTTLLNRLTNQTNAPKLKIIVFGGSTAEGTGCHKWNKELFDGKLVKQRGTAGKGRACAWPYRLQVFLDKVLGGELVEIHNLAVGGTHSGLAGPFLKYWLYPPFFRPTGPDIVINAYAANDNLPAGEIVNTTRDDGHAHKVLQRNLEFVRHAWYSRATCSELPPPLVLYVDDYLGNHQDSLLGDGQVAEWWTWFVEYWNNVGGRNRMGFLSPASVVRPWVLAETTEVVFSPQWIQKNRTHRNVHFGMSGHVYITWVIAYSLLEMTITYCRNEERRSSTMPSWMMPEEDRKSTKSQGEAATVLWTVSKPDYYKAWIEAEKQQERHDNASCRSPNFDQEPALPCVFAFLAAPLGTHSNQVDLNNYLNQYTLHNEGWTAQNDIREGGYQNKLGLVATMANATLALGIPNRRQQITPSTLPVVRTITLHTLKSYGEKWRDSRAKFTLEVFYKQERIHSAEFEIEGYHNQTTSISEPYELQLDEDVVISGSSIRFTMELVGGSTFKMNALMFCSR